MSDGLCARMYLADELDDPIGVTRRHECPKRKL
jgi:hypothetical protein